MTEVICGDCETPLIQRRIVFGKLGYIEMVCCECEASRLTLKYANTKDTTSDVDQNC